MRMEWQSWAGDPNEGGRGWLCFHICPELRISAKFSLCKQSRRKNNPGCFPERTPPEVEYNPTSMKNTKQFTNGSVPVWVSTQEATSRGFPHVLVLILWTGQSQGLLLFPPIIGPILPRTEDSTIETRRQWFLMLFQATLLRSTNNPPIRYRVPTPYPTWTRKLAS